jgi:hypothetical protein
MPLREWGLEPVRDRAMGIGRLVIGGLFVRDADGFAPGIGAVGVDVFVLGEGQGLHEGLAEIQRRKADPSLPSGAREQQPTSEGGRYMTTGARGLALPV